MFGLLEARESTVCASEASARTTSFPISQIRSLLRRVALAQTLGAEANRSADCQREEGDRAFADLQPVIAEAAICLLVHQNVRIRAPREYHVQGLSQPLRVRIIDFLSVV